MKIIITAFVVCLLFSACSPEPGDSCKYSEDCPPGMICDRSSPGGYCLNYNCELDADCPDNTTCVFFDKQMSFCLKKCSKTSDCRKGYACRSDIGQHKFCYVEADGSYGRDEKNRIESK